MNSIRNIFGENRSGFFSNQNQPILYRAALLLVFGKPVDATALDHYYHEHGNSEWVITLRELCKRFRFKYAHKKFETILTIKDGIKGEK